MLCIDYFAEFQVDESCESVGGSGGDGTVEPSSDSPDEEESDEKKHSKSQKRKHGEFEASNSLHLCTYELQTFGAMRKNRIG